MQLKIERARQVVPETEGHDERVTFHLSLELEITDSEREAIFRNQLQIFTMWRDGAHFLMPINLIGVATTLNCRSLEDALDVQNAVIAGARELRALVDEAMAFEGTTTIEIEPPERAS